MFVNNARDARLTSVLFRRFCQLALIQSREIAACIMSLTQALQEYDVRVL